MRNLISAAALVLFSLPSIALADSQTKRLDMGRDLFVSGAEPACSICHTLADAQTEGEIGPNLDSMRPNYDRIMRALVNGVGPMMPYDALSEEELDAVSHYVSSATDAESAEP